MGGRVLEYEAKTIYRNGLNAGIERGRSQGLSQGISQGISRGVLKTVLSMLKKGRITESEAAEEAGMSVAEFKKAVAAMGM